MIGTKSRWRDSSFGFCLFTCIVFCTATVPCLYFARLPSFYVCIVFGLLDVISLPFFCFFVFLFCALSPLSDLCMLQPQCIAIAKKINHYQTNAPFSLLRRTPCGISEDGTPCNPQVHLVRTVICAFLLLIDAFSMTASFCLVLPWRWGPPFECVCVRERGGEREGERGRRVKWI